MTAPALPRAFIWRRVHSLAGFWLTIYLIEHLFVNSQAALFFGQDGESFIRSVNAIHELPYLPILEVAVLAVPILIHLWWGVKYLWTSKTNSYGYDGKHPYLPEYGRNHAYTWQRITSWVLIVAIIAHVVHMRFMEYPAKSQEGIQHFYMVRVDDDQGIGTLAERLQVKLYNQQAIQILKQQLPTQEQLHQDSTSEALIKQQKLEAEREFVKALEKRPLKEHQWIAVSNNFGTAELLMLRETFKIPIMMLLYTLFVLAACFHAFNGLWTFLISWGATLSQRSQKAMLKVSKFLMVLVAFLGLITIFGTYWINLRH
ncbi:MAG: succinate dehydrogenase [Parachlamydiaceae bacterium]